MNQKKKEEFAAASSREVRITWLCVVAFILTTCAALPVSAATGRLIAQNTPSYVSTAKNLGRADPSKTIEVSIWLNPHNRGQLDALAGQLYDRTSPNYRHWLTRKEIAAQFAPTATEAKTVQRFFGAHNMKVVSVGPDNFFVRARGTLGDVEKAFHVRLNNYQVLGKVIRANDRDPFVEGAAAALVQNVSGLDTGKYEHPMMTRAIPQGKGASFATAAIKAADIFSPTCFNGLETESFSTNNNGSLPIGTYSGNHLNLQSQTSSGCAYTPPMIQAAYNLTGLYNEGYTGSGQTIGIIDWCGSFTIQSDANAFSAQYGLPPLTLGSNFAITNVPGPSFCEAFDQVEINIDVEWAHAIAPGANINLIVPPSASFQDVNEAEYISVNRGLANVLSGSYGSVESFTPASVLANENLINEIAAVLGISANFSSGDNGDFTNFFIPATVSAPADSPWATAVGGVTLALNPDNSIKWQAGWGNNQTLLAQQGAVFDPPIAFSFIGGAGGGPSNCASQDAVGNCLAGFPKPSYQKKLPGKYRQLPDISWLADPYTGAAILISIPGQIPEQVWQVWGGTSVACPMFAALWAIANQEALAGGGTPLGLAAPYMYSLPAGTFYDIVPVSSKTNVTASLQEPSVTNTYDDDEVVGGVGDVAPPKFVSALWDYPLFQYTALVISFGTDCAAVPGFGTPCNVPTALHTKVGWDNVTGMGTPNAQAFADSFFGK
jgi:subtilase family serine protease